MRYKTLIKYTITIISITFATISCVSNIPKSASTLNYPQEVFHPSQFPVTNNDLREAIIKQKELWRVSIIKPIYENEDYDICAIEAALTFINELKNIPWFIITNENELLSIDEAKKLNTIFYDEPQLITIANERNFDGLIMLEVVNLNLESIGLKIDNSNSDKTSRSYARNVFVTLRIKVIDTFDKSTLLSMKITGHSTTEDTSLDTKLRILKSATKDAVFKIKDKVTSLFKPQPTIIEVRGDGKYVKVNVGTFSGISEKDFFDIFEFIGIKDPSGKVIFKEAKRITSVPIILIESDYCWCDATLSQGMIKIGQIAIRHRE